ARRPASVDGAERAPLAAAQGDLDAGRRVLDACGRDARDRQGDGGEEREQDGHAVSLARYLYGVKMRRKRTLTRDRVVEAALELIDGDGLGALSMRRLGAALGVEGMALYTHVRDKDDLLDAVAVRVLDELELDFDRTRPWQERIRRTALAWAGLQARHPRAFPLVYRPATATEAPREVAEEMFDALRTAGFGPRETALAYQTI